MQCQAARDRGLIGRLRLQRPCWLAAAAKARSCTTSSSLSRNAVRLRVASTGAYLAVHAAAEVEAGDPSAAGGEGGIGPAAPPHVAKARPSAAQAQTSYCARARSVCGRPAAQRHV